MVDAARAEALERVSARVRELAATYEPPDFAEVPTPDAALFLSAIDHSTGYEEAHEVDGEGPFEGSALLWALGLRAETTAPGALTAPALRGVGRGRDRRASSGSGRTSLSDPEAAGAAVARPRRAAARATTTARPAKLIAAAGGRARRGAGAAARASAAFEAFSDPLAEEELPRRKIWERRGWLEVADPESWEVCADNVLMRLALRSGLVEQGDVEEVRAATRDAFRQVADGPGSRRRCSTICSGSGAGRTPTCSGAEAGDLREPPRRPAGTATEPRLLACRRREDPRSRSTTSWSSTRARSCRTSAAG